MAKSIGEETRLAIQNLSPWIPAYGRHAIIQRLLEKYQQPATDANSNSKAYQDIAMKLYEVVEGGYYAHEIIEEIINSYKESEPEVIKNIRGFARFTVGDYSDYEYEDVLNQFGTLEDINLGKSNGINLSVKSPSRQSPNLFAIEMMDPDIGLAARDSSSVSIFTSLIPTLELSRCIPYINIKFSSSGSNAGDSTIVTRPSISTFLGGFGSKLEDSNSPGSLGYSSYVGENSEVHPSHMELFLSPQTMTPAPDSQAFSERRDIPVALDRFRPLMSLKGLSFSVVPSKGFMSYKSGKMEITLHDRSRLRDISSLVTPGVYQGTEFDIEYGWSHPDGDSSRNSFGAFLNGLKVREKYGIVNSTFSFGDSGQVDISINIAMKGAKTVETIDISGRESLSKEIEGIISEISRLVNIQSGNNQDRAKNIFGETIVESISNSDKTVSLSREKVQEIRTLISQLERSGVSQPLVDSMRSLYGVGGKLDENQNSVDELVSKALEDTKKKEIFPFSNESSRNKINKISNQTVSFGKLLLQFIGKPLVNSGEFEEVQFIFHPMNNKASWMRNLSIAKFPIDNTGQDSGFEKRLKEFLKENMKMSASEFFNFIASEFVSDPSAPAYGMHDFFEQEVDSDGNPTGEYKQKKEFEGAQGFDIQNKRLISAGINDGNLVYVKPEMYPECVPYVKDKSKTILRLHVVDSACKSYNTLYELLKSVRLDDISTFGVEDDTPSNLWSDSDEVLCPEYPYLKAKKEALFNLIKERVTKPAIDEQTPQNPAAAATSPPAAEVPADDPSKSKNLIDDVGKILEGKSLTEVKKFISEGMPTIYYGSSGGAITNVGISSLADSKLATMNIINMTKTSAEAPDSDRNRNIPIFVMPTQCTVEMIGCPILQYGQFFFMDLKTGTTADNMYWVTGLDHKLGPEGFTTSAKLTLVDAYGAYRNSARRLDYLSAALAKKFGLSIPERKGGGGGGSRTTSNFDVTSFFGLDKLPVGAGILEEISGNYLYAVFDREVKILTPNGKKSRLFSEYGLPFYTTDEIKQNSSITYSNDEAFYIVEFQLPTATTNFFEAGLIQRYPGTKAKELEKNEFDQNKKTNIFVLTRGDSFFGRGTSISAVAGASLAIAPKTPSLKILLEKSISDQSAVRDFANSIQEGKKLKITNREGFWCIPATFELFLNMLNGDVITREAAAATEEYKLRQKVAADAAAAEERRRSTVEAIGLAGDRSKL